MDIVLGLAVLVGMVAIYILPGVIAEMRKHKRLAGVWIVTVFLGWTFVGWVGALAWAASGETKETDG
ncbi:MAG: superinfection immunity protein [Pseudomonadota bacterium]